MGLSLMEGQVKDALFINKVIWFVCLITMNIIIKSDRLFSDKQCQRVRSA